MIFGVALIVIALVSLVRAPQAEACFGGQTQISLTTASKNADAFQVGDSVLTAQLSGSGTFNTREMPVAWTECAPPLLYSTILMRVSGHADLILSLDQPVLLADGKTKKASQLTPTDMLLDDSARPVGVTFVQWGQFGGALCCLATSFESATTLDNHIVFANGIAVGDYALQSGESYPDYGANGLPWPAPDAQEASSDSGCAVASGRVSRGQFVVLAFMVLAAAMLRRRRYLRTSSTSSARSHR
ncbi:MAG: hypothetical protein ACHQ9S_23025 [Candidatus Binatia bacterium]